MTRAACHHSRVSGAKMLGVPQFAAADCPQCDRALTACFEDVKRSLCYFCPCFLQVSGGLPSPGPTIPCLRLRYLTGKSRGRKRGALQLQAQTIMVSPHTQPLCSQMQLTGFVWSPYLRFGRWHPTSFAPFHTPNLDPGHSQEKHFCSHFFTRCFSRSSPWPGLHIRTHAND